MIDSLLNRNLKIDFSGSGHGGWDCQTLVFKRKINAQGQDDVVVSFEGGKELIRSSASSIVSKNGQLELVYHYTPKKDEEHILTLYVIENKIRASPKNKYWFLYFVEHASQNSHKKHYKNHLKKQGCEKNHSSTGGGGRE